MTFKGRQIGKPLKGKYHTNLMSCQNPKMFVCQVEKKGIIVTFVINYPPMQCNKTVD